MDNLFAMIGLAILSAGAVIIVLMLVVLAAIVIAITGAAIFSVLTV